MQRSIGVAVAAQHGYITANRIGEHSAAVRARDEEVCARNVDQILNDDVRDSHRAADPARPRTWRLEHADVRAYHYSNARNKSDGIRRSIDQSGADVAPIRARILRLEDVTAGEAGDGEQRVRSVGRVDCNARHVSICLLYTSPSPRDRTRS